MHFKIVINDVYLILNLKLIKVNLLIEGDTRAPFSIATTPKGRGGHHSFLWITPLYSWSLLSVKQGSIKYHFLSLWYDFGMTRLWTIGEHSTH